MPTVLVASDSQRVREAVQTALVGPGFSVVQAERGQDVAPFVTENPPDLVILDMQIGNMGGMATAMDLHLEASADRCEHVPIVLLLDRPADKFLARRSEVEALIVKPFDSGTLRRVVNDVLAATERAPSPSAP